MVLKDLKLFLNFISCMAENKDTFKIDQLGDLHDTKIGLHTTIYTASKENIYYAELIK